MSPLLKDVPGVNEVNSFGGYFKEYQIEVRPDRLLAFGITLDDVYAAIGANNQNVGGNIFDHNAEQYIVRGVGVITSAADIGSIVLRSVKGVPVSVRDVADVRVGQAVRQGASLLNGTGEAVGGIVMMLRGENGRDVVERVKAESPGDQRQHDPPPGVRIVPYYDRSDVVWTSIRTVTSALLEGSILVIIVLYLMLRSLRGALVVIVALPLSLGLTFVIMMWTGLDANLMSLGGLAISIGMIIDATIIQVENVQRHLSRPGTGERRLRTVLQAVLEVRQPSIFGEIIIATTFLPILSLEGLEGKMFAPLALTVAIALFSSLALSISRDPGVCGMVLTFGSRERKRSDASRTRASIRRCSRSHCGRTGLLLASPRCWSCSQSAAFFFLGTEFMPVMDEGAFDMDIQLLPGISLGQGPRDDAAGGTEAEAIPGARHHRVAHRTDRRGPGGPRGRQDRVHRGAPAAVIVDDSEATGTH